MPGSVALAAPSTVMPFSLCTGFTHARAVMVDENEYRNGESQRGICAANGGMDRGAWSSGTAYATGDVVTYSGLMYFALQADTNHQPNISAAYWSLVTSRKRWQLTKRLAPTDLATLRTFYNSANGPHGAFYFYDVFETSPKFSYDATGVATVGRYTVRFDSPWQETSFPARSNTQLALVELA